MGEVYGLMRIFLKYSPPEPTPKQARKKIQAEKRIQKNQVAFLPAISLHGEEKFLPTLWTAFCEISSLTTFNTGQGKMDGDFQMFFDFLSLFAG